MITQKSGRSSGLLLRLAVLFSLVFALPIGSAINVQADESPVEGGATSLQQVIPSIFGADIPWLTEYWGLNYMAEAGAYWVRPIGLYWSLVQPDGNQEPDWTVLASLEGELQSANDEGMQVILRIQSSPEWAQAIPGVACGPIAEEHLGEFGDFMFALVSRYADLVQYWELWNEPDVDPDLLADKNGQFGCWGDEDDEYYGGRYYAEMLKTVYPRIKAADPDAQVLVGGLLLDCDPTRVCPLSTSGKFLEGILLNEGSNHFDGVSFHAYDYYLGSIGQYFNSNWGSTWDTTGPAGMAKARYINQVLANAGVTEKYLMNTESAIVCDSGCDDDFQATKAYYLAESYANAAAAGLQANLWFSSRAGFRNTDLIGFDGNPLPAYYAYKFGQSILFNAEFIGMLKQPGIMGYEFRKPDCPDAGQTCRLWMVRSMDGGSHTIDLPDVPYHIYDVNGDVITPTLRLTIDLEPLYIELPPGFTVRLPELNSNYQVLANGDFEFAMDSGVPAGWTLVSGGDDGLPASLVSANPTFPSLDEDIPIGSRSMLLGRANYPCSATGVPLGYAAVEQTFTVPDIPDGESLELEFKYVIYTQDGGASDRYDRFEVFVDDGVSRSLVYSDGRTDTSVSCANWYRLPTSDWKTGVVNLLSPVDYRGQTITLSFQNWSRHDHWYNTFTYLDEVRLSIGNSGQ